MTSISSSSQQYRLALNILLEHFGPVVQEVGGYLLRRGQCTLVDIRRYLDEEQKGIKLGQIKEALVVLIQHNLLKTATPTMEELQRVHPRTFLYYQLDLNAVTLRLRFPKFLLRARELFGEEGQAVLEELVLHGRLNMSQLHRNVEAKLRARRQAAAHAGQDGDNDGVPPEALAAGGGGGGDDASLPLPARIRKAAEEMAKRRYVVRVVPFDLSRPTTLPAVSLTGRSSRAKATEAALAAQHATQQSQANAEARAVGVRRRRREDGEEGQGDEALPAEIALMITPEEGGGAGEGGGPAAKRARAGAANGANGNGAQQQQQQMSLQEEEEETGGPRGRKRKAPAAAAAASPAAAAGGRKRPAPGAANGRGANANGGGAGPLEEEEEENMKAMLAASPDGRAASAQEVDTVVVDDDVLWRVGVDQFHRDFRHQACCRFVRQKVNATAEALVKAVLAHSLPLEREVASERSAALDAAAIARQVPLPANVTVKMYMDVLKNDQVHIVGGGPVGAGAGGGSGGGTLSSSSSSLVAASGASEEKYCVYLANVVESLRQRTLHSIVRERYSRDDKARDGDRNARICRVLLDKKYLDQQQLSELAMMSLRETRERLYAMYRDEIVTFQEVPRRADHHPNQTFYLWAFNSRQVTAELLDRMYKGALNLRLRRQRETAEKGDLLANKDNIRDEVEAAHFDRLTTALDRLDQALENLDETIMLFTVF